MARRSKLTKELIDELCTLKAAGASNKAACDGVCINESTFYDWYNRGEADIERGKSTLFSEFSKSYKKAETSHKLKRLRVIQKAAEDGNWKAAAWELERRYPAEYGRRTLTEVTGKDGGAIHTELGGELAMNAIQIILPDNGTGGDGNGGTTP